MSKFILALIFLFIWSFVIFAQTTNQAEAKWEIYAFREEGFSVSLPKPPIVVNNGNWLISEDTERFGAYTNGTAYVVSRSQKSKDRSPKDPQQKPFSKENFATRLAAIRQEFENRQEKFDEAKSNQNGWQIFGFIAAETIYKLYYNPKSNNWIELWAIQPNESKTEVQNFFASFKFEKTPQGKEIGAGASETIGDLPPTTASIAAESGDDAGKQAVPNELLKIPDDKQKLEVQKLRLVLKPRANYTEEARKNQISGTVRVRVTFSALGGISSVRAITDLPYGLTEQAIAAAKRILFVPEKRNGVRISVNKVVEYNFNLY